MEETTTTRKPVLLTTAHRGVFFGYEERREETAEGLTVTVADCRCALRWATTGGFLELASQGPNSRSKIGARAPRVEIRKVTSVTECSPAAAEAWERAP